MIGVQRYRERNIRRLELMFIAITCASTVCGLLVGVEPWREIAYTIAAVLGAIGPTLTRRILGAFTLRDLIYLITFGLLTTTALSGGLESPWLILFVTLTAGAAGLLPSREARLVLAFALAMLAFDIAIEVVPVSGLDVPPFAYDRTIEGPGRTLALLTLLASVFTAIIPGGMLARATIIGTARALHLEEVAKVETVASLEARSLLLSRMTEALANELAEPLARTRVRLDALIARSSGVDAERLTVLARETRRFAQLLPKLPHAAEQGEVGARSGSHAISLQGIVGEVVAGHRALAAERGVALVVAPNDDAASAAGDAVDVRADAQPMRQVLVNLVQNAIEASPRGETVTLSIARESDGRVAVHVDDRGPGISPEVAPRLFASGFTTKEGGSGIGLVVARSLAERLNGALSLANRAGGGCRATLLLPVREPVAPAPTGARRASQMFARIK